MPNSVKFNWRQFLQKLVAEFLGAKKTGHKQPAQTNTATKARYDFAKAKARRKVARASRKANRKVA